MYRYGEYSILQIEIEALKQYVKYGFDPGAFLRAVLENDLISALGHANDMNMRNIPAYVEYMEEEMPRESYGSPVLVQKWMKKRLEELE